ncbi:MAG: PAS domain-containing sensor histidine kinase [Holosporaceae bacterium]|jgi:PAS domain S-box-containing protein|nr:PAS domain-containing sensor histidine kinase [Holosporaceae bacterium]
MLKKIIETIKSTFFIFLSIVVPLVIGVSFIKSSLERDSMKCIDTFMESEGAGLSKYMALQFENTQKDIDVIAAKIDAFELEDPKFIAQELKSIAESDKNIVSISLYNEKGHFLANSSRSSDADLTIEDNLKNLNDEVMYTVDQLEDKSIVMKYMAGKIFQAENGKKEKFFIEIIIKWDVYEKYMNQMEKGSFARTFFIISENCNRYVSFNSLPEGGKNDPGAAALGMHLVNKIKEVPLGLSEKDIQSFTFKLFKSEIQTPKTMKGEKFFVFVAIDDTAAEALSKGVLNTIPMVLLVLSGIWLLVCSAIARFHNKANEQLEIANAISDSTPLAIIIYRFKDGKILKINLSATTLLRIDKEHIETVNMWNLFIEDDDKSYITNAISSNINVLNYEVLVQSFGGGSFWSICSASPIEMDEEKYIVLAVLDINRRKEVEKKLANNAALLEQQVTERTADLEQKAKELEESNQLLAHAKSVADEANNAKSKFLTNMSNELKTPLNAIIGYSEILEEEALDRKDTVSADDLRKIIGSAKHLLSLIEEILDLSKIEAGKIQLFFENIEIIDLIKDVEGVTMPLIAKNDNSLFLECPKDIGSMYSDSTKIRQCLLNLLSNAAKFTEFGKVTIRVTSIVKGGEDFIEFAIIDTGVGIDASKIDGIFESFQNDSNSSGTGLGLSLAKKYVEYLGGTISVESELGGGSKFVVRIPRTCKTSSNESIEIKNQRSDEIFEEFVKEDVPQEDESSEQITSFSKKSDDQS